MNLKLVLIGVHYKIYNKIKIIDNINNKLLIILIIIYNNKYKLIYYCKCNRGNMTELFMSLSISGKQINFSCISFKVQD